MAIYTITTAVNIDTLTSKAGADTYNINGTSANLTIDQDSRYGLNGNTSAILGAVSPSSTLGGSVIIDGRLVRLIPYNTGSGTVPADGITITKGSASGVLIGVYSALNVAPTAAGGAMPASGYLKIKQWNSVAFSAGALTGTGLSASATGADVAGWIEVVGQEAGQFTPNRLNQSLNSGYCARGEWYIIGTTSGSRATTYQIPSNGVLQYHAGVYVENPTTSTITAASWDEYLKTVTVTSTAHGFESGDQVTITGISPSAYNSTRVPVTKIDANHFSYFVRYDPGTYASGGTATGNWEFYQVTTTSALQANIETDALRGKVCWIDTAGVLRFGNDGTNSTGGYLPPSGRSIRIGNVFLTNSPSATKTQNSLNAAVASRFRPLPTGAGVLKMDKVSCAWALSTLQTGKTLELTDCAIVEIISASSFASQIILTRCGIGSPVANASIPLTIASHTEGALVDNCVIGLGALNGSKVGISLTSASNITMNNPVVVGTGPKTSPTGHAINLSLVDGVTINNLILIGVNISPSQTSNGTIINTTFIGESSGRNSITFANNLITMTNKCSSWVYDGVNFGGIVGGAPRNGILSVSTNCSDIAFRNMGSYDSPIDLGETGAGNGAWTRVTTTATVTKTSHGLRVGDTVFVYSTSAPATIAFGAKTITAVTTNTFDFVCLNAGATSGVVSYFISYTVATLFTMGANTSNVTLQNVHVINHSSDAITTVNTMKTLDVTNMTTELKKQNAPLGRSAINLHYKSVADMPYGIPALASSIYGTHFVDEFVRPLNLSKTGVSWTRSGTTATVTSTAHGLKSTERIQVANSSNTSAIPNGQLAIGQYTTVLDDDTFTLVCANLGATSGTLDYRVEDGRVLLAMNEANATTNSLVTLTGAAAFTGVGSVYMPNANDSITWEMDYFAVGFDNFPLIQTVTTSVASNYNKYDLFYQIDLGSGFGGTYKNLNYNRVGGGGTSGLTTVTMTDTTGVNAGDYIFGIGIADGAKVVSITNSTDIVVSIANAATVSGVLMFNQLPNETIPTTGFRFKVKMVANQTNTDAIGYIWIPVNSTATSRKRLYSQLTSYTLSLIGLQSGSDIRICEAGTVTSLLDIDANSGTTYDYTYYYSGDSDVDIQVTKDGYEVYRYEGLTLGESDQEFIVAQQLAKNEGA